MAAGSEGLRLRRPRLGTSAGHERYDFSPRYSHAGLLVQGAVAGLGVGLVQYALAAEDIRGGRLRICAGASLPSRYGYRFRCSPARRGEAKVRWFETWIRAELAKLR